MSRISGSVWRLLLADSGPSVAHCGPPGIDGTKVGTGGVCVTLAHYPVGTRGSRASRNQKGCQQVAALGMLAEAASLLTCDSQPLLFALEPASLWPCDTMLPPLSGPLLL